MTRPVPGPSRLPAKKASRLRPASPTVRAEAIRILARVDEGEAYADILLDRSLRAGAFPDPRDRSLLTELVMGTLRRRGTIDHLLASRLSRPLSKADGFARNALRVGAYQLLYLRMPVRAALFETVAAVKRLRGEAMAGFVNAVLRGILRDGEGAQAGGGAAATPPRAELSAPEPLLASLSRSLGEEEAAAFLSAALDRPPFVVRANPFRESREALLERFAREGREPSPCRYAPDGIVLSRPPAPHADPGFREGRYLVMDEGAQLVAPLLSPREGETILDACAAPGGKTSHLAALAGGRARVLACDVSEGRVSILGETLSRLGVPGVATRVHDFAAGPLPAAQGTFDRILVDAPCSGMGVIGRNPDAKWRFTEALPARMALLQAAILRNAWASLAAGGSLLYCTCSPLREEDEDVVEAFVGETGALRAGRDELPAGWPGPADACGADGAIRLLPHRHGTDGFFAVLLRKSR